MAVKKIRMSSEGYKKLEEELEYLSTEKRKEIAEKLSVARGFGDLSENSEYDEAKNEQGIIEARIQEINTTLANAVIVDESELLGDAVDLGAIVTLKDLELNEEMTLKIVGSTEADPNNNKISEDSPIGIAIIGKKVGDIIEVEAPIGTIKMEILDMYKNS